MAKSITKNFVYNILLNISAVIFPLITAPYVSRVLEPDGIGINSFASTYSGYFALVALLGIPTYGVREVSKLRDDKESLTRIVSQLMSIATISTLIVSLIYISTVFFIGKLSENYIIFLLAGFAIYLSPFSINWFYQGLEDFGYITLRTIIIKSLSVLGLFLFVHKKDDLIILILLNVIGTVLVNAWNFAKMLHYGIHPYFTLNGLKPHIKPLFTLFASSIAISVYTVLDTLMLGFITDYNQVGYYSNAMQISRVLVSAVTSLSIVAVPRVAYYLKNKEFSMINELIDKSFSIVTFLSFPIAIGIICIASSFVPLFFGQQFEGSIIPLMVLSILVIVIGLNNLTGVQILIGMGEDKLFLHSVLIGTLSNMLLNTILIPVLGAIGASIASVVAESLILLVTFVFVYKKTQIRIRKWSDLYKAIIGSLVFIPLILLLNRFFSNWTLVLLFVFLGSISYFIIETILKNSSMLTVKKIALDRINSLLSYIK